MQDKIILSIVLLTVISFSNLSSVCAEESRTQIIFSFLDKIEANLEVQNIKCDEDYLEKEVAIAQALNQAGEISKKDASSSNILSDFYFYSPLLSLMNILTSLSSQYFVEPYKHEYGYDYEDYRRQTSATFGIEDRLTFGTKVWLAEGTLKWRTSTDTTKSRLIYPNDGLLYIVNSEYRSLPYLSWLSLDFNFGIGENHGEGTDTDWLQTILPEEWSKTTHDSDGNIYFYETNLYANLFSLRDLIFKNSLSALSGVKGFNLDFFTGYHFHKASYRMTNGQWQTLMWLPVSGSFSLDSSYKIIHKGTRIGLRSILNYTDYFNLEIRAAYLPNLESKGIGWWNNRILNFVQSGGDGYGFDSTIYVSFRPTQVVGLEFGCGYRHIHLLNRGGTSHSDEEDIGPWDMDWDEAKSVFKGPFFDCTYRW